MKQSNLHICFGDPKIHLEQLETWQKENISNYWTINRHARKGDRALFYIKAPLSSFVALGKVMDDAYYNDDVQSDWNGHYMATIGEIKLFLPPISLKEFQKMIPEWGFLKIPRQSVVVPSDIVSKINTIINENNLLDQTINYTPRNNEEFDIIDEILIKHKGTEKECLQYIRIGQKKFRESLIEYWKGSCAVTKCSDQRILRASHIKPWRSCNDEERLDPFNGLLLLPNLDATFDQGLITFDKQGRVMISPSFKKNATMLGITEDMEIHIDERHQKYIDYHRKYIYQFIL